MSCSARLPVYLLMIATLMPGDRVPLLAKVGLIAVDVSARHGGRVWFFFACSSNATLLKAPPLMIMELPPYRSRD